MYLRVTVTADGRPKPVGTAEIVIPDMPETPKGVGKWVWQGRIPAVDVPVSDGWVLSLRPLRKDSVAARERTAKMRARANPPLPPKPPAPERFKCSFCTRTFLTAHARSVHTGRVHSDEPSRSTRTETGGQEPRRRPASGGNDAGPGTSAERRVEAPAPTAAEDVLKVLTYHFQGRAPVQIIAQMRNVMSAGTVRIYIGTAYKVLNIPQPPPGHGPDPRAVQTFVDLSREDRLRFAERVLNWKGS